MTAPFGPGIDLRYARLPAQALDLDDVEQVVDLLGQLAEAVDQLGGEGVDLGARLERRQAPVEAEAQLQVGDVALGDQHRGAERDRAGSTARRVLADVAALQAATASSSIDW